MLVHRLRPLNHWIEHDQWDLIGFVPDHTQSCVTNHAGSIFDALDGLS